VFCPRDTFASDWPVSALALAVLWVCFAATAGAEPLVSNGDFERPDPDDATRPACWDKPDGLGVRWESAPDVGDGRKRGRAIRMDTSVSEKAMVEQWRKMGITKWDIPNATGGAVGAAYGLSYYSEPFGVQTGTPYRVTFDYMGPSGGGKVWVRAYGEFRGEMRRRYETMVNCYTKTNGWTEISRVFHPTRHPRRLSEMRVMLYAYWPPGVYWFDNVRIETVPQDEYEAVLREEAEALEAWRAKRRRQ